MVGTTTYAPATNIITTTGGTAGAPITFNDLWLADKAGTYNIVATRNIIGADGAPVAVSNALRPTDYVMLGKADLYLTVTNFILDSTIQIVGTDYLGNPVTEDIAITADGVYNTTKFYKTVTSTQVTVYGDSFTYQMDQGQWGIVWKQETNQYAFDCKLQVGDDVPTATWFKDSKKQVLFNTGIISASNQYLIMIKDSANFIMGVVVDAALKTTKDGVQFMNREVTYLARIVDAKSYDLTKNIAEFYACSFICTGRYGYVYTSNIWNGILDNAGLFKPRGDINRVTSKGSTEGGAYGINLPDATVDDIFWYGWTRALYTSAGITISNLKAGTCRMLARFYATTPADSYLINADVDSWTFEFDVAFAKRVYRQYTFDLKVTDPDGVPINAATVELKNRLGTVVFSVSTAADGSIVQQTVSRGYYAQATGDTLQEYSPHNLTITKGGYELYDQDFTLDEVTDWEIALLRGVSRSHGGGVVHIHSELEEPLAEALAITLIQKRRMQKQDR